MGRVFCVRYYAEAAGLGEEMYGVRYYAEAAGPGDETSGVSTSLLWLIVCDSILRLLSYAPPRLRLGIASDTKSVRLRLHTSVICYNTRVVE